MDRIGSADGDMARRIRGPALAAVLLVLARCNVQWVRDSDKQSLIRDTLYFGGSIPGGGAVAAQAWESFVAHILTPAFPRGYTVLDGQGVWRRGREPKRLVIVLHADDAGSDAAARCRGPLPRDVPAGIGVARARNGVRAVLTVSRARVRHADLGSMMAATTRRPSPASKL